MDKFWFVAFFIILASLIITAYFFPIIPSEMPIHWNIHGEIDQYAQKEVAMFIMPSLSIALLMLLIVLPKIDPLKRNYEKFMLYYKGFVLAILIFFFWLQMFLILASLGYVINVNYWFMLPIGFLFIYISILMKKSKRNWFVGIRTPWTLSSDKVWEKTHRLGSLVFFIHGVIFLCIVILSHTGQAFTLAAVASIVFSIALLFVYSYLVYIKEKK